MGWNDRLGVGPGYTVGDMNLDEIREMSDDELKWLKDELTEFEDQAAVVQAILDSRNRDRSSG